MLSHPMTIEKTARIHMGPVMMALALVCMGIHMLVRGCTVEGQEDMRKL